MTDQELKERVARLFELEDFQNFRPKNYKKVV
jgi:hypothetical protein